MCQAEQTTLCPPITLMFSVSLKTGRTVVTLTIRSVATKYPPTDPGTSKKNLPNKTSAQFHFLFHRGLS